MPRIQPLKIIRASAGSGKTFSLTAHYLVILFSGAGKYREILAVTFTNKATAEMKSRILGALAELSGERAAASKFSPIIREHYPALSDVEIRLRATAIYRSILHDYSRFSVSTIDGFVQQVIRSFAFELHLDSGYRLEMNQEKVKDELVKALNKQLEHDPELLKWVTGLAIERINDGRDWNYQRALKDLANEIFKERYYPFQEAMLALGDEKGKAFEQLKQTVGEGIRRFEENLAGAARTISQLVQQSGVTADDLANKSKHPILQLKKVIDGDFAVISRLVPLLDDYAGWPHKSLRNTAPVEALFAAVNPVLHTLVNEYQAGIEQYYTYKAIYKNSPYLRLMQEMAELLKNYRSENRALLISDAQQLLKGITGSNTDNPSFIWEKTGNRYKHFLFDEFQDTSSFQWMNFLPLVKNALAESRGEHTEHLIVGDVKQSIYRWRNGDWRILHSQVKGNLLAEQVAENSLEFNRRSHENIIRFNNFLYETLPAMLQQQLNQKVTEAGRPLLDDFWEEEYGSIITRSYEGSTQKFTDATPAGGKVEVELLAKNDDEDSNDAALRLLEQKIAGLLRDEGCAMRDICILVRKNAEAEQVVQHLVSRQHWLSEAAGKQFQVLSGEALKIERNRAVRLLVTTMRMLATREEENSTYKAACARLLFELDQPGDDPIGLRGDQWMRLGRDPLSKLTDLLPEELCRSSRELLQLPLTTLTEKLMTVYRLGEPSLASDIPFLLAFRDQVAVFTAAGDQGLPAFLEWWDAEGCSKALPSADSQDAVNVMTVHKSKGLEFKAVLLPFCDWSFNQHTSAFNKKLLWVGADGTGFEAFATLPVDYEATLSGTVFAKNYFEEMLLSYMDTLNTLYVATTRAREYLYLVVPQKSTSGYRLYEVLTEVLGDNNRFSDVYRAEDGRMSIGEMVSAPVEETRPRQDTVTIGRYPLYDAFSGAFTSRHVPADTWFNDQQRRGTVLHQLLASVTAVAGIQAQISLLVQEGSMRESERDEFQHALTAILSQEQIGRWMETATEVKSEQDILVGGGRAGRPDKVFVFGDRVVILDFKFGGEQASYTRQLNEYRQLLLDMERYSTVEAYIWYDQTQTLHAVS